MLEANKVQGVGEQNVLDLAVHRGGGAQRGTHINLHDPRFQVTVNENIKPIQLEPAIPLLLGLRVNIQHHGFGRYTGLNQNPLDLLKQLHYNKNYTFSVSMPCSS